MVQCLSAVKGATDVPARKNTFPKLPFWHLSPVESVSGLTSAGNEKAHCHHFALNALFVEYGNVCGLLEAAVAGIITEPINKAVARVIATRTIPFIIFIS